MGSNSVQRYPADSELPRTHCPTNRDARRVERGFGGRYRATEAARSASTVDDKAKQAAFPMPFPGHP